MTTPESSSSPGEVEVFGSFFKHLGPRCVAAGVGIQFHYNQVPGIHFKVDAPEEYREAVLKGLQDAMAARFPAFPSSASIWVTRIEDDGINSSWSAFYKAARMAVEQAYSLSKPVDAS